MSLTTYLCSATKKLLVPDRLSSVLQDGIWKRFASKKTGGSSKNHAGVVNPKHRGVKYNHGKFVQAGTLVATQYKLRFHPGLNVGIGKNGSLFALIPGKVVISSEKIDPDMDNAWNQRNYAGRDITNVYKKYFHVLPEPQHCRFKRID